jgi:hypothetical protein
LIKSLAKYLVVDRHWLEPSDERHEPEYLNEVFQRLIFAFILQNRDENFMDRPVDGRLRKVEPTPLVQKLTTTLLQAQHNEANKKRPSPQHSTEEGSSKRPRLDAEVGRWYKPFISYLFSMLCVQASNLAHTEEMMLEDEEDEEGEDEDEDEEDEDDEEEEDEDEEEYG